MTSYRRTQTQTRTASRRAIRKAMQKADLTHEEELVLRLRYGLSEPRSTHLAYRGSNSPEIAAKLALIEADALARMRPRPADKLEGHELKQDIIDKLRRI